MEKGQIPIKVCLTEGCYAVCPSATRICKFCGSEFYPKREKKSPPVPPNANPESTQ